MTVKMGYLGCDSYRQIFLSSGGPKRFPQRCVWTLEGSKENINVYSDSNRIEKSEFKVGFTRGMMRSRGDSWVYMLDTSVA